MPLLFKSTRTSQPQGAARVDWSNNLCRGLEIALTPTSPINLVTQKPATTVGITNQVKGRALTYNASSGRVESTAISPIRTFFTHAFHDASNTRWGIAGSTASTDSLYFEYSSGSFHLTRYDGGWGLVSLATAMSTGMHSLAMCSDSASSHRAYYDGALKATSAAVVTSYNNLLTGGLGYFQASTRFDDRIVGQGLYLAWNRALSPSEIKSLSDNPWQIFAPQARSLWIPSEVAGGVISANPGNAVGSGVAASVTTSVTVFASVGNAGVSGVTAVVQQTIPAVPGNATAAGTTASITSTAPGVTISATVGNASADGALAAVVRRIEAAPGDALANGSILTLLRTISASPGDAAASGVTASVTINASISATPGNAVAAGSTARITSGDPLTLILKLLRNRQQLNATTGMFTVYDDDAVTVLYQSAAWADSAGTVPYAGGALRRIDALA